MIKKLTTEQLLKLAKMITTQMDLYTLAIIGLAISEEKVETSLTNHTEINMAVYHVLKEWRTSQISNEVAYDKLCDALKNDDVNMASLISKALE